MGIDWVTYLGVVALAYLIPGPDFLIIMRWSTRNRRSGVAAALGAQTGLLCHLLLAAAGLSILLARYSTALSVVRIVGGFYLIYLGGRIVTSTLRHRPVDTDGAGAAGADDDSVIGGGPRLAFGQGWLTNVTNPKAILFFAAVLPQFVNPDATAPSWLQIGVLGSVDVAAGAIPWAIVIVLGVVLGDVLNRRRVRAWWDRCTGTALVGLGAGTIARG